MDASVSDFGRCKIAAKPALVLCIVEYKTFWCLETIRRWCLPPCNKMYTRNWFDAVSCNATKVYEGDEDSSWYSTYFREKDSPTIYSKVTPMREYYGCSDNNSIVARFGPFTSMPGQWTGINHPITSLFSTGDKIVKYKGYAIDRDGVMIGYPPLHMHHLHVCNDNATHWFETHGDYYYAREELGESYATVLERPLCNIYRGHKVRVSAELNDVRFQPDAGMVTLSRPRWDHSYNNRVNNTYTWYLHLEFTKAPVDEPCKCSSKLILYHPSDKHARSDRLDRYLVDNQPHVRWWSYTIPERVQGVVSSQALLHAHRGRHYGTIVVRGQRSLYDLFATHSFCTEQGGSLPYCTVNATQALIHLRDLFRTTPQSNVLCSDLIETPTFVKIEPDASGNGGFYDRQSRFYCNPLQLLPGQNYTLFAFSAVNYQRAVDPYPQHMMALLRYVDTDDDCSKLTQLQPNVYHQWNVASNRIQRVVLPS